MKPGRLLKRSLGHRVVGFDVVIQIINGSNLFQSGYLVQRVFCCSNGGSTTKNRTRLVPEDSIRRAICRYNEGLSKGNYGLVSMSRWDTILGPAAPVRM